MPSTIWVGNLLGNTWDAIVSRRSDGRLGDDHSYSVVKVVALAERLALMGSHFYAPGAIRAMLDAHGVSVRIEADGPFAAWVVAEKR